MCLGCLVLNACLHVWDWGAGSRSLDMLPPAHWVIKTYQRVKWEWKRGSRKRSHIVDTFSDLLPFFSFFFLIIPDNNLSINLSTLNGISMFCYMIQQLFCATLESKILTLYWCIGEFGRRSRRWTDEHFLWSPQGTPQERNHSPAPSKDLNAYIRHWMHFNSQSYTGCAKTCKVKKMP